MTIRPFPRKHRPGAMAPMDTLAFRRCLCCGVFGCVVCMVTPRDKGGEETGDNLIPLCHFHAQLSLGLLSHLYPAVKQWLLDHERIDALLEFERGVKYPDKK